MPNIICELVIFAATLRTSYQAVVPYFCEFGLCDDIPHQVCCGVNKCCADSVNLGYFWAGALILIAIIIAFLIRFRKNRYELYMNVPTDNELG